MKLGSTRLDRRGRQAGSIAGSANTTAGRRLAIVDEAFSEAIARGLAHLTAEDQSFDGRFLTLNGQRLLNFGLCSYLGLEIDPRLKDAASDAVLRYGVQFASSRAYVSCPPYGELQHLLETLFAATVVIAQTTTLAHFSALPILVGKQDAVICDQLVHSSVQAVLPTLRATGAHCAFVRHNRMDRLDEMIDGLARQHARVWYLADGIYSMHGDAAPIVDLQRLAARHEQLHLYMDDAHGVSWSGRHGRGYVLGKGRIPPRTVVVASLAKGFSGGGAALIFPDKETARLVRTCGGPLIFSGPLQPALLGANIASARIHLSPEIERRQLELLQLIELFNTLAAERGIELASATPTPIRFVNCGDERTTYRLAAAVMKAGYYTNTAVFPAVSQGRGGLRITLTLHHTPADIRGLIDAIARHI